jgi:hypothetical protein
LNYVVKTLDITQTPELVLSKQSVVFTEQQNSDVIID